MSEERQGRSFLAHEFDEAIVIQRAIVETEQQLAREHPLAEAKEALEEMAGHDEEQLKELQRLGKAFGATGRREEVASAMEELANQTVEAASGGPDSEKYEAHAVLLSLKRKQIDAATAMRAIGDELGNEEMIRACGELERESRSSGDQLARLLSELAVDLATRGDAART